MSLRKQLLLQKLEVKWSMDQIDTAAPSQKNKAATPASSGKGEKPAAPGKKEDGQKRGESVRIHGGSRRKRHVAPGSFESVRVCSFGVCVCVCVCV